MPIVGLFRTLLTELDWRDRHGDGLEGRVWRLVIQVGSNLTSLIVMVYD